MKDAAPPARSPWPITARPRSRGGGAGWCFALSPKGTRVLSTIPLRANPTGWRRATCALDGEGLRRSRASIDGEALTAFDYPCDRRRG